MDLVCVIKQVSLKAPANSYVFVQFKDSSQDKSFKFRTEIVPKTEHPKFHRNNFTFDKINVQQIDCLSLKFGLFSTSLSHDSADLPQQDLLDKSASLGVASMKLSINAIAQLQEKGFLEHALPFVANKSEIGRIYFAIKVSNQQLDIKYRYENAKLDGLFYNPFEEDTKMVENNIKKLEQAAKYKVQEYQKIRKRLGTIRSLQQKVHLDEDTLRKNVDELQKSNEKLNRQLSSKIDPQSIKTEFELLKDTSKGQALLIERLLYLKERIKIEKEQQVELAAKKKLLQPTLNKQIQQTQKFSKLQQAIKQQRFHMHRGSHLLRIYNDLVSQITSNELIVRNLKEMSKKSDLTAKQALIILEQAKYENELKQFGQEEPVKNNAYEIMDKIEGAAKFGDQEESQQFIFAYQVKLQALRNEIAQLDTKIKSL